MPEDIYSDFCGEPKQKFEGHWTDSRVAGSCNACYSGDYLSGMDARVFQFNMHGLVARLCAGHLRRLFQLSRYR